MGYKTKFGQGNVKTATPPPPLISDLCVDSLCIFLSFHKTFDLNTTKLIVMFL